MEKKNIKFLFEQFFLVYLEILILIVSAQKTTNVLKVNQMLSLAMDFSMNDYFCPSYLELQEKIK